MEKYTEIRTVGDVGEIGIRGGPYAVSVRYVFAKIWRPALTLMSPITSYWYGRDFFSLLNFSTLSPGRRSCQTSTIGK